MDSDTSEAGVSSFTSLFPIAEREARTSKVGSWRRARAEALAGCFFVSPLLSLSVTQRSLWRGESENKFPVMSRDFVAFLFIYYQLFWTQTSPEGMCTNGTLVPSEVPSLPNRTIRKGWPHHRGLRPLAYSFRIVLWVLLRSTRTDHRKCCKTKPTVFHSCPRRLESLTICRCHYKGSTFFSVI